MPIEIWLFRGKTPSDLIELVCQLHQSLIVIECGKTGYFLNFSFKHFENEKYSQNKTKLLALSSRCNGQWASIFFLPWSVNFMMFYSKRCYGAVQKNLQHRVDLNSIKFRTKLKSTNLPFLIELSINSQLIKIVTTIIIMENVSTFQKVERLLGFSCYISSWF